MPLGWVTLYLHVIHFRVYLLYLYVLVQFGAVSFSLPLTSQVSSLWPLRVYPIYHLNITANPAGTTSVTCLPSCNVTFPLSNTGSVQLGAGNVKYVLTKVYLLFVKQHCVNKCLAIMLKRETHVPYRFD